MSKTTSTYKTLIPDAWRYQVDNNHGGPALTANVHNAFRQASLQAKTMTSS
jgi:hypothetical protein